MVTYNQRISHSSIDKISLKDKYPFSAFIFINIVLKGYAIIMISKIKSPAPKILVIITGYRGLASVKCNRMRGNNK